MLQKTTKFLTALFFLLISACVSQMPSQNFDRQQAAKARVELGLAYLAQQNVQQAKQNLDKAHAYAPDYYLVHSALAYFYQSQGDDKQGDVYNNYGTFLCANGEFNAAYKQFSSALNSPNYYHQADTYENIALCALSEKNDILYRENLTLLEKTEPKRAERLKQLQR